MLVRKKSSTNLYKSIYRAFSIEILSFSNQQPFNSSNILTLPESLQILN